MAKLQMANSPAADQSSSTSWESTGGLGEQPTYAWLGSLLKDKLSKIR